LHQAGVFEGRTQFYGFISIYQTDWYTNIRVFA